MTLVRVSRPAITRSFDDIFRSFFDDTILPVHDVWRPALDVCETKKSYELSFAMPGFEKKNITVSVKNNELTVKAVKESEKEDESANYLTREIARGSYERVLDLPENVNTDKIAAEYKSGILTLSIPKTKEALPKEIAVTIK